MSMSIGGTSGRGPYHCAPRPPPSSVTPTQALMVEYLDACEKGTYDTVKWFLRYYPRDADVHRGGKTALMHAAANGRTAIVSLLAENGASLAAADNLGWTALHYAASGGTAATIKELLGKGCSPHARNKEGATPLHEAATGSDTDIIGLLLAAKAQIEAKNNDGETPLCCAVKTNAEKIVRFLLDQGAALSADPADASPAIRDMLEKEPARRGALNVDALQDGTATALRVGGTLKLRRNTAPKFS